MSKPLKQSWMLLSICVVSISLLSACSTTESDNVATKGIYATIEVAGNNANSVNCEVQLQVGGPTGTYLDLSAGDSLTCNGNTMARNEFLGIVTYTATLTYAVGATYTIEFVRAGEGTYTSTAVLPGAISGASVQEGNSIAKGQPLTALWTASTSTEDSMYVTLSYSYLNGSTTSSQSHGLNDTSPENGSMGFSAAQTQVTPPVAGNFDATLTLKRSRGGTMATGLDGSIRATQKMQVTGITLHD